MVVSRSQVQSHLPSHPQSQAILRKPLRPLTNPRPCDPCPGPRVGSGKKPGATRRNLRFRGATRVPSSRPSPGRSRLDASLREGGRTRRRRPPGQLASPPFASVGRWMLPQLRAHTAASTGAYQIRYSGTACRSGRARVGGFNTRRIAPGRAACQRASHVLRCASTLQGDTPSAPPLRQQLWALRPGLDGNRPGRPTC